MTAVTAEDTPPPLGVMLGDLAAAQVDEAAARLSGEVEQWLRDRTAAWPPEQLRLLAGELRARLTERRREAWVGSPLTWARQVLHVHLWSKQREIVDAVRESRRVAVPSCHGAGKTFTAAVLAAWWLSVHEPGTAFVVSTAPTFAQVRAVLWREINRLHKRADLPGHVNQTEWHIDGELVGFGRKPADTDESAFQGIHAPKVLVLIDEAGGVPEQLWTAAEAVAVGEDDRIVAFGNPDDPEVHFARACRGDSLFRVVPISAFDTPNLTGETLEGGVPPGMVTRRWVEDAAAQWGTDSPLYASKVLGRFPEHDESSVVRPGDVAACRLPRDVDPVQLYPVELGVDVGGGGDMTSVRARHGIRAGRSWTHRTPDPEQVVQLVMRAIAETPGVSAIKVDSTGIGWGVASSIAKECARTGLAVRVVPVQFGSASRYPKRLKNLRAELWWEIGRMLSQDRAWDLSAVDDATVAQLLGPRWSLDDKGRIVIEPKEDVVARTGRSPDDADALLLAFYVGVMARATTGVPTGTIPTGAQAVRR